MPRSTPRSLANLTWPVTTDRLSIRPAEQRDAAATYAFRSLPEVAEWVTSRPTDLTSWEQGYADRLADTLIIELDGVVVGDLMLRVQDAWAQAEVRELAVRTEAEIGYTLDPAYGGRGLATEACSVAIPWAFRSLQLHRLEAVISPDNPSSLGVARKLGLELEGMRKSFERVGTDWLDQAVYVAIQGRWRPPAV